MRYVLLITGLILAYFAYQKYFAPPPPPPPPPPQLVQAPPPMFSEKELEKIRNSAGDSDPAVRWESLQLLAKANDSQVDGMLIKTLHADDSPDMRMNVLTLLSSRGGKKYTKEIIGALKDSETTVRIAALNTLGSLGDFSAVGAVGEVLHDSDETVRLAAIRTLNDLQSKHLEEVARVEAERKAYEEQMKQLEAQKRKKWFVF